MKIEDVIKLLDLQKDYLSLEENGTGVEIDIAKEAFREELIKHGLIIYAKKHYLYD